MKKLLFVLTICMAAVLAAAPAATAAPIAPTFTATAAAITATTTAATINITLASTTGISATVQGEPAFILIDQELFAVVEVPASGTVTVRRKQRNTVQAAHPSGAYAVFGFSSGTQWSPQATGSPTFGVFIAGGVNPVGGCTLTSQQYSPVFVLNPPTISGGPVTVTAKECHGGEWVGGNWPAVPAVTAIRQCTIPMGSLALTAYGTDATRVAGTIYVGSIDIPGPVAIVATLLSSLTGTTSPTTDKQVFALYDYVSGTGAANTVATTALAGVAAATADIMFDQNLTTPVILVPGRYLFALQVEGTTTSIQMVATGTGYQNLVGNSRTGTFGTMAAITVPTTLTTSTAPIGCIG